ncbi:hypothetical protein H2200_003118 [Cladophialophora chaetospira]|uniref:Uncharacterized protein n=1 Tax=Cladophialophora chaetospira TaxID=386627 RepID=A0AA39CLZ6_9EURO|nr:hypothetical protein H2200_003118 [Cladophialophora chaetospira]
MSREQQLALDALDSVTPTQESSPVTLICATPSRLTPETQLLPVWKGFGQHELPLVEFLFHPDQISSLVYGPTFQDHMRSTLAFQLAVATEQLKDGVLVFAKALFDNKNPIAASSFGDSKGDRGSRALQKLGNLATGSVEDARTALHLALMLVTYNDLSVGVPTLPISRSALLQAMPWRHQLIRATTEDTDPNIICLLFVEMAECLVLGQMPVFRYEPPPENTIIDRYYGISQELLPFLYDLCTLSRSIRTGTITWQERNSRINEIANEIDQWKPELVLEAHESVILDAREKYHFLLQAKAFKSATQLLLLQAQGSNTSPLGRAKATQVLSEVLDVIHQGIDRPKYVLFPYFVACLELSNVDNEMATAILATMNEISNGMAPSACQSMLACLKHIWRNQRRRPDLTWFECVDQGLMVAMGP